MESSITQIQATTAKAAAPLTRWHTSRRKQILIKQLEKIKLSNKNAEDKEWTP